MMDVFCRRDDAIEIGEHPATGGKAWSFDGQPDGSGQLVQGVWAAGSRTGAHAIAAAIAPVGTRFTLEGIQCEVTRIDDDGTIHVGRVADG